MPTLPAGFAYNAQNWLVMQPAGQDSPVKICSWLQVAARTRDPQGDTSLENKGRQLLSLMGELATQKAISVNCIGWHHHAYVHPRLTFYPSEHSNNPRMVLQTMHPIEGFIQQGSSDSWRATANGLEGTALAHNDALLALDEMGEVDPKEAGDVAYMLANGQGKTRAGKYGEMRLPTRWRLVFLSTGEVTLESHLASIGKRVKAGQQVRVIDLSADAGAQMGVFNHSHGMNAADLADHLKQQSRRHYGSLALDWLRYLTQHSVQVRPVFQNVRQRFLASLPPEADGQVRRQSTNGRRLPNPRWQPTTAQSLPARQHPPTHFS